MDLVQIVTQMGFLIARGAFGADAADPALDDFEHHLTAIHALCRNRHRGQRVALADVVRGDAISRFVEVVERYRPRTVVGDQGVQRGVVVGGIAFEDKAFHGDLAAPGRHFGAGLRCWRVHCGGW